MMDDDKAATVLNSKEVRVLVMLSKAPLYKIVMSNLGRRLNVNAGIKAAEKNEILDSLKERGLIELSQKRIPALKKKVPTFVVLTSKGLELVRDIKRGDITFSDM